MRAAFDLVVETFQRFDEDGIPRVAAAMSYFLLLALAPVLLIVNAIVGWVTRSVANGAQVPERLATVAEKAAATFGQASAWAGGAAPYVAIALVIFGAVSVFGQFVGALQLIWHLPPTRTPIRQFLRHNALAFALLGVASLALLAAIVVGGIVTVFGSLALSYAQAVGVEIPGVAVALSIRAAFVFVVAVALFWVSFTVVPERRIRWRDTLLGSVITAALFVVGELWLSYFLGSTQRFSVFGTFEFFVILIVWIYYSALVALWGAELTRLLVLRAEGSDTL